MKPFALLFVSLLFLAAVSSLRADLAAIENQYRAAYELHVGTKHAAGVADLDAKYIGALERGMQAATQGQRLDEALGLRDEIQRVKEKQPLPEKDDGVDPAVAKFRGIYLAQFAKLLEVRLEAASSIIEQFGAALAAHQEELIKAGKLDEAYLVRDYRAASLAEKLMGGAPAVSLTAATAAPEKPFENSLGMRFVPVPITGGPSAGKTIRFSVWETRVKDYARFAKDTNRDWPKPEFEQEDDHPAVMVSWEDATAFSDWLTKAERRKRKIGPKDVYRLPTDHEWSCAVGIGKEEDASAAPVSKSTKIAKYPWGTEFPPKKEAGNYRVCDDGFDWTAPVGSFTPNAFGLHDLGGNAMEYCLDFYDPGNPGLRVMRGHTWYSDSESNLRSSRRNDVAPSNGNFYTGFRVVLEVGTGG